MTANIRRVPQGPPFNFTAAQHPEHSSKMAKLVAKWQKVLEAEPLQRSSQIVSVVDKSAYVFGGELRPREPRDNDVHVLSLDGGK